MQKQGGKLCTCNTPTYEANKVEKGSGTKKKEDKGKDNKQGKSAKAKSEGKSAKAKSEGKSAKAKAVIMKRPSGQVLHMTYMYIYICIFYTGRCTRLRAWTR